MVDVFCFRQNWIWMLIGKCLVKMLLNINHSDCDMNIVQTHLKYVIATLCILQHGNNESLLCYKFSIASLIVGIIKALKQNLLTFLVYRLANVSFIK